MATLRQTAVLVLVGVVLAILAATAAPQGQAASAARLVAEALRMYSLEPGWRQAVGGPASAPALADVDKDSALETVVVTGDGKVQVWRHDGTPLPGWPQTTGGPICVFSAAAVGDLGIMFGYADDVSCVDHPEPVTSRDPMAVALYRAIGSPSVLGPHSRAASPSAAASSSDVSAENYPFGHYFLDVPNGYWAYAEITAVKAAGLVGGWSTESGPEFRPEQTLCRDRLAAFLMRAFPATVAASGAAGTTSAGAGAAPSAQQIAALPPDAGASIRPSAPIFRDAGRPLSLTLGAAGLIPARAKEVAPGPAWDYRFPAGLIDEPSLAASLSDRYLAVPTARWAYHPVADPGATVTEGENALYYFDVEARKLLWKQSLGGDRAAFPRFVSDSGDLVLVSMGSGRRGNGTVDLKATRDGRPVEGKWAVGEPEPGLRAYDRAGELVADRVPVAWQSGVGPGGRRAFLRPPADDEREVGDSLRAWLAQAGVESPEAPLGGASFELVPEAGGTALVSRTDAGETLWSWPLPAGEGELAGPWQRLSVSPDHEYAVVMLTPTVEGAAVQGRRRLYLFARQSGLVWARDLALRLPGRRLARTFGAILVARGAESIVLDYGPSPAAVDIFDRAGNLNSHIEFGAVVPGASGLSPSGRYWASALRRMAEGPGTTAAGWRPGICLVDCRTGKVAWQGAAFDEATTVMTLDSGTVTALSSSRGQLAVFAPQEMASPSQ